MNALKKPAVAAMIMVICIIIALLIGRAGGIEKSGTTEPGWAETVNEVINDYSTVGTLQKVFREVQEEKALVEDGTIVVDEKVTKGKRTTVSTIIIILGVILVIKGVSGKK